MDCPRPDSLTVMNKKPTSEHKKSKIRITITPDNHHMDSKKRITTTSSSSSRSIQMGGCSSSHNNDANNDHRDASGTKELRKHFAIVHYRPDENDIDKVFISKNHKAHFSGCECNSCTSDEDNAFNLDNMSIVELSRCVDFGISDFLCYNDEVGCNYDSL